MTRTRWRIMASLLITGLGGFVVLAEDQKKPAPTPVARRGGAVAPVQAVSGMSVAELPAVAPPVPEISLPPAQPIIRPDTDAVAARFSSDPPPPAPTAEMPTLAAAPPTVDLVQVPPPPQPPAIEAFPPAPTPSAPTLVVELPKSPDPAPPAVAPVSPPEPAKPIEAAEPRTMPTVTLTVPPAAPAVAAPIDAPAAVVKGAVAEPHSAAFPWKLCLEVASGLTQLEVKRNDELLMKVQCEKFDLHAPSGGIQAAGKVVVTGPCVEARCDRLMIAWQSGQVALDGSVRMTFQSRGGMVHEMRAESVTFRLTGANAPVDFTAREVQQIVAPPKSN